MSKLPDQIKVQYARRDATKGDRYAWHQLDVMNQETAKSLAVQQLLRRSIGKDLSHIHVLDVGCGTGTLLRSLLELGVQPQKCTGIDFLSDRIEEAISQSPQGMQFHVGGLESVDPAHSFDLVTAFTVLSSVLDVQARQQLINEMWDRVKPGGWMMIFDFRFNNPRNRDVRAVKSKDFDCLSVSCAHQITKSLLTPPPIARRLCQFHSVLDRVFAAMLPIARSHSIWMFEKPHQLDLETEF